MIHFSDFLSVSISFNASKWKLVNRDMFRGYVGLTKEELGRLLEEKVRKNIQEGLPVPVNDMIKEAFKEQIGVLRGLVAEQKAKFREKDLGEYSTERTPPCVKNIMEMLASHENPSHEARFFLATFLVHIGFGIDRMMAVFSRAPDFNEDIARYQLEQISGDISGTKYTPPSCGTLKTKGLCLFPDSLCGRDWMTHPLTYYKIKGRSLKAGNQKFSNGEKAANGENNKD